MHTGLKMNSLNKVEILFILKPQKSHTLLNKQLDTYPCIHAPTSPYIIYLCASVNVCVYFKIEKLKQQRKNCFKYEIFVTLIIKY